MLKRAAAHQSLSVVLQTLESSEMGRLLTLLEANFCSLFEAMSPEVVKTLVQAAIDRQVKFFIIIVLLCNW